MMEAEIQRLLNERAMQLERIAAVERVANEEIRGEPVREAFASVAETVLADILLLSHDVQVQFPGERIEGSSFPSLGALGQSGGWLAVGAAHAALRRATRRTQTGSLPAGGAWMWADTPNHMRVVAPLGRTIPAAGYLIPSRRRPESEAQALQKQAGSVSLVRYESFGGFSGLIHPASSAYADLRRLRRRAVVEKIARSAVFDGSPTDQAFLRLRWRQIVMWVLPLSIALRSSARSAMDTLRPRLIVFGHDGDYRGNLLERAARSVGVRTAVVQHGVIARPDLYSTRADEMLSFHSIWHSLITSHEGTTRFTPVGSIERFGAESGVTGPSSDNRVLVATNPSLGPLDRRIDQALAVCGGLVRAGAKVTWRPHPAERRAIAHRIPEASAAQIAVDWAPPIDKAVRDHAVTLVESSGVGLAALLAGRPVVVLPALTSFCGQLPSAGRAVQRAGSTEDAMELTLGMLRGPPDPEGCTASARNYVCADGDVAIANARVALEALANA